MSWKTTWSMAVVMVVAFVLAPATASAQKQLRWKFTPGDARDMVINQTINVAVDAGGQNVEMKMTQTMVLRQTVESVENDGSANLTQQFTQIKMKMEGAPGASFDYDSTSDKEPEGPIAALIAPIFGALTKGKFESRVTNRGEIVDVKVPQEMVDAASKAGGLPGVAELFTKDGLNQMLKQNAAKFPEQAVKKGDTWQDSMELNNPVLGKQTVKTAYTYLGEETFNERSVDKLSVEMTIEFGEPPANSPAKVKVTNQSGSGVLRFDAETGQMVGSEIDQNMKMEVTALGNVLNQNIKSKTIVTVKPAAN